MAIFGHMSPINIVRTEHLGSDSEGRSVGVRSAVTVQARVAMLSAAELADSATYGEAATAVACVEIGTDVLDTDLIEVTEMADQLLDGEWNIAAVRSTPIHLRILLRRR